MITDAQLALIPIGSPLSMVAAAGVSIPSAVLDLLGAGVGVAPPSIIGNVTLFGTDQGIGSRWRPELECAVGTAFVTGNGATLNLALQCAVDTGVGGGYQPGTWTTIYESGAIAASVLIAGRHVLRGPILPVIPASLRPRFLRLLAQIPSGENFTAGTLAFALWTWVRDDWAASQAARNYTVA